MTASDLVTLDFLGAVEDLAAPAYVIDRDGRFSWVNRALIELLGDLRGKAFVEHVAPEHRQLSRTNFTRKVVGKATGIFDLRVLAADGRRVTLRITSAPLRRGGRVVGIFGVGIPLTHGLRDGEAPLDGLTPRQQEVLSLLAEGLDTPEIARRLGVAPETARNHIRGLLRATGAHSRLEAVLVGLRAGLLDADLTRAGQQDAEGPADK